MSYIIETRKLSKTYSAGAYSIRALRDIDLKIEPGEFLSIMGASGSGKSTLLNLLGCLDASSSGEYFLDRIRVDRHNLKDYADFRNQKIGFVFQNYNLLARTTALENVEIPLLYDRKNRIKDHHKAAVEALKRMGLEDRMHHLPQQLSGGQQQRVAIARALVNRPALILADEPTGSLDSNTSIEIMSVFQQLNNEGITIILVTHEKVLADYSKRRIELKDGLITGDYPVDQVIIPKSISVESQRDA